MAGKQIIAAPSVEHGIAGSAVWELEKICLVRVVWMGAAVLTVQSIYDHLRNSPKMSPLKVKLILSMMEPCKSLL